MRRSSFATDPLLAVLNVILGVGIALNVWLFILKGRNSDPLAAASSSPPENEFFDNDDEEEDDIPDDEDSTSDASDEL